MLFMKAWPEERLVVVLMQCNCENGLKSSNTRHTHTSWWSTDVAGVRKVKNKEENDDQW